MTNLIYLLKQPEMYAVFLLLAIIIFMEGKLKHIPIKNIIVENWKYLIGIFLLVELFVAAGLISGKYHRDIYDQAVAYEMDGDYVNAYTSYEKILQYGRLNANEKK